MSAALKSAPFERTYTFVYLQYLRGIAALMVVYFHSVIQLKNLGINMPLLPLAGEAGVDIFFVLSGFLMWITTSKKAVSPLSFILNRLMRIVPLYWMLTIGAGLVVLLSPSLLKHTVFEISHFIASLAFFPALNPAYLNSDDKAVIITPLLVPGWTLNYEIFFYIIFAATLFFPQRLRLLLVVLVFCAVALAGQMFSNVSPAVQFYSNPIISEFVMGIGVAILVQRLWLLNVRWATVVTLVATVLMMIVSYKGLMVNRAIAFGIPAALIVYGLCCLELNIRAINSNCLRMIGDASYSLYLTHVFTLVLCRLIFQRIYETHSLITELIFIILCLCLSLAVGVLTYHLYEKPVSVWLKKSKSEMGNSQ